MGHHLIELAKQNPDKYIIGVDPFLNGIAEVIFTCVREKIENIFISACPIQEFLEEFKKLYFDEVFILFPDPWPKKKHHKRRLFQADFIKMILKKIISKGRLFFATDNEDYYEKSLLSLEEDVSKTTTILIQKKDNKRLVLTKYFKRAQKLGNNVNFLVIVKL